MANGVNISYKIFPGNEYTTSIPNAVYKLMYPGGGLSNPMVLSKTTVHGYGLRDLYSSASTTSIMYGYISGYATGVTWDANSVLNSKY